MINGFDIQKNLGEIRGSISLTGQFATIDEILTGRENIEMIAELRHLKNPKIIFLDEPTTALDPDYHR